MKTIHKVFKYLNIHSSHQIFLRLCLRLCLGHSSHQIFLQLGLRLGPPPLPLLFYITNFNYGVKVSSFEVYDESALQNQRKKTIT